MAKLQNKKFCKASIIMNNKTTAAYPKASVKPSGTISNIYGSKYNIDHE
jgi:hypothetical protein